MANYELDYIHHRGKETLLGVNLGTGMSAARKGGGEKGGCGGEGKGKGERRRREKKKGGVGKENGSMKFDFMVSAAPRWDWVNL